MTLLVILVAAAPGSGLAQVPASQQGEVQQHLRLAQEALTAGSTDGATQELQAVLAIDKGNATAWANLGALAFVRADWQAAADSFEQALRTAPTLTKAEGLLAICKRRLGDPSAQTALEAAFPKVEDPKIKVQVGLELVNTYQEHGNLYRAAGTLAALLEISPNNADVLYVAQRLYQDAADAALDKLAILSPESARMQQVTAEHLIRAGDLHQAIDHFRAASRLNPNLPGVHYELGESLMQSSHEASSLDEAGLEFAQAIRVDGESAQVEARLGMLADLEFKPADAFEHYSRAHSLSPGDADALMGLSKILMERKQYKEAAEYLRSVVEADPMNVEARYRLFTTCKQLGLTQEANQQLALFRQAKAVKRRVEDLYAAMNKRPIKSAESKPDPDQ